MVMTRTTSRIEPMVAASLAMMFALLALYGCWSIPDLVQRWGVSLWGVALLAAWSPFAVWAASVSVRTPRPGEWAGFAAAALAMRLASMALAVHRVSVSDPGLYLDLARHLIAGEGLYVGAPGTSLRLAEFPPVYPVLLAGWGWLFGLSSLSVLMLSTLLDLGAATLIARLGRRLGEPRPGLAAAALYLVWPAVLFDAPLAQKESLEILLVLALIHGWLGVRNRGMVRSAFAVSIPAALLALTQPGVAALAGITGIVLVPRIGWRRVVTTGAAAAVVAAIVMLPWWVRNWHVLHAFVPLTSAGGLSLWIGENAEATGNWMPYPAAIRDLPELAIGRAAARIAIDWMTHHPLGVLRLNIAKFLRAVGLGQFAITRLSAMTPGLSRTASAALLPLTHGSQILLLGAGAASLFGRRLRALTALLLAVVLQMALFGVWFEFSERHRELLTPLLLLGVTVAVRGLAGSTRRRAAAVPTTAWPATG